MTKKRDDPDDYYNLIGEVISQFQDNLAGVLHRAYRVESYGACSVLPEFLDSSCVPALERVFLILLMFLLLLLLFLFAGAAVVASLLQMAKQHDWQKQYSAKSES